MMKNETCRTLCRSTVPPADATFINERIREDQAINWVSTDSIQTELLMLQFGPNSNLLSQLVDGLPAAEMKKDEKSGETFYDIGFNLGNDELPQFQEVPAMYNHYDILIK